MYQQNITVLLRKHIRMAAKLKLVTRSVSIDQNYTQETKWNEENTRCTNLVFFTLYTEIVQ